MNTVLTILYIIAIIGIVVFYTIPAFMQWKTIIEAFKVRKKLKNLDVDSGGLEDAIDKIFKL